MSEYLEISGGTPLAGEVRVGGAKNAALPQLMACLLTAEKCILHNIPNLEDVTIALHLLEHFGAEIERYGETVKVSVPRLLASEASYTLVKALRASFWVLSPLLARGGAARVALPGGDIIGARPVDIHLESLVKMGAEIQVKHGVVYASAPNGLKRAVIDFRFPSVGATHQIIMAAALTPGETVIKGAACEPEVSALAEMINKMGGSVEGAGTSEITIRGRETLGGAELTLIGDRIEAGTYLLAGATSGGKVTVRGFTPSFLGKFLDVLKNMGLKVECGEDYVSVENYRGMQAVEISTGPFPELATDLQAPLMAALCFAEGVSKIEENIYEGRFGHVSELCRMGADIKLTDRVALINSSGVSNLTGAEVEAMDIRAAASLVIAALGCKGTSLIGELQHLRRGYEMLETKLLGIGAKLGCKMRDPEDFIFSGC
jgi:UDP-N-acetylglucosamine 1-carboxyvinyltransferase